MKPIITPGFSRRWLGVGLSLAAAVAAQASTDVTFMVDMNAVGAPTAVYVNGTFNGWGTPGSPGFTNNGANIWSQTITITDPPGTVESCKFMYDGNWESDPNRQFLLGSGTQVLPMTSWNVKDWPAPTNQVTFQVDLSGQTLAGEFIPGQTVAVAGDFENWDNFPTPGPYYLTNNPTLTDVTSNIYSGTFPVVGIPPAGINYKFRANGAWESPVSTGGNNRQATITNANQVLPVVYYNDIGPSTPTNYVTFQVDLSAQTILGSFMPGQTVTVSGGFENWGDGQPLTNNPTLPDLASNIYSGTYPVVGYRPVGIQYKFRANGGWESPASTGGNNRTASITSSNQVLPLVFYNDNSIHDLVLSPITVTFTLYMTNGTLDKNGYAFNNSSDTLWINGDFLNNWNGSSWPGPVGSFPAEQQMIEVGLSDYYTNSFVIPTGNSIYLNYKYSIDSQDDENGSQTNHVREVRSYGPNYTMPQDVWSWNVIRPGTGNPYPNAGIARTNIVEPDFGYLNVGVPSAGKVPITWLGRPGVVLQNNSSLTGGAWNDNNGTDATMSTNWPNAGGNQFFRLKKNQ